MTQTKLFKIARATVVLVVQLAWILVKLVLLAAAAVLRGVTSGPAESEGRDDQVAPYFDGFHESNPGFRDRYR